MKTHTTRRSFLLAAVSLFICIAMLAGTTYAWFTDSVTSSGNIIKTGKLEVTMHWADGVEAVPAVGSTDWIDASTSAIFDCEKWEPGYTVVRHIKIENIGSLALKYKVNIVANGEVSDLSDVIDVYYVDPATQITDRTELADKYKLGTLTEVLAGLEASANGTLKAGDKDTITIAFRMQTSAGNEYMEKSIGTDFSVQLIATQLASEADSFGTDYDDLALYPDGSYHIDSFSGEAEGDEGTLVTLVNDNKTFIVEAYAGSTETVTATIAAATPSEALVAVADAAGRNVAAYDIDVVGQTDGSAVNVSFFIGKSLMGVTLYHNDVAMLPSEYSYDPNSGFVTFASTSFSPFSVIYEKCDNVIGSYADYNAVKKDSGTHVIGNDFTADNIIVFAPGSENTIDLNGKTVTAGNRGQFLFGMQRGGTLTITGNGTVDCGKGFMTNKENAEIVVNGGTYYFDTFGTTGERHHNIAQNSSKIVINGGRFISTLENTVLFFATSNSTIEINGGFFESTVDKTPDLLGVGKNKYDTNRIIITGGTFVNYNPLEDEMTYKGEWPENGYDAFGGPWILIPGGYTVVSETQANGDVWYSVVPVQSAE